MHHDWLPSVEGEAHRGGRHFRAVVAGPELRVLAGVPEADAAHADRIAAEGVLDAAPGRALAGLQPLLEVELVQAHLVVFAQQLHQQLVHAAAVEASGVPAITFIVLIAVQSAYCGLGGRKKFTRNRFSPIGNGDGGLVSVDDLDWNSDQDQVDHLFFAARAERGDETATAQRPIVGH